MRPNVSPLSAFSSWRSNQPKPATPGWEPAIQYARLSQSACSSRLTNQLNARFARSEGTANSESQSGLKSPNAFFTSSRSVSMSEMSRAPSAR